MSRILLVISLRGIARDLGTRGAWLPGGGPLQRLVRFDAKWKQKKICDLQQDKNCFSQNLSLHYFILNHLNKNKYVTTSINSTKKYQKAIVMVIHYKRKVTKYMIHINFKHINFIREVLYTVDGPSQRSVGHPFCKQIASTPHRHW